MKLELKHYAGYLPYSLIGDLDGGKVSLGQSWGCDNGVVTWDYGAFDCLKKSIEG